jgi:cytochrome P450
MAAGVGDPDRDGGRAGVEARWLVDGMNLIGVRPDRWWNYPDRAVRRLIQELDRYAAAMVAFASRAGRNAADDEIVRVLAADPAPSSVRVVTSDKRLAERARALGAGVRSPAGFRRRLDEVAAALTDGT